MHDALTALISFLLIINPFALCLYLAGVMEDLKHDQVISVLTRAAFISFITFVVFALAGEPFLTQILGIRPEAMRIFGGAIFFNIAYSYVTKGYKATEMLRGDLDELPSEIALPFMIGAGTITQSIVLGKMFVPEITVTILFASMAVCVFVVLLFKFMRERMRGKYDRVFTRYVNMLSRANGLLIGAISVEMIIGGIHDLWLIKEAS